MTTLVSLKSQLEDLLRQRDWHRSLPVRDQETNAPHLKAAAASVLDAGGAELVLSLVKAAIARGET